jgi:leader peptidase (prepilin peptidase) / N-methyltransferase
MVASTGLVDPVSTQGYERAFLIVVVAIAGLLIGSFLNVVVHRVPAGRSVVRPRSACPRCGEPIGGRDNVPVLSWLRLRGRSRCCGEPISVRYPLVEAATAAAFGAVAAWAGLSWLLPALLYLAAISIALALIDIDVHRLPDAIVLPAYPIGALLLVPPALVAGEPGRLVRALVAGAGLYLFYFLMMLAYPAGMGFGDVKLAGVLGLYLGFFGWSFAFIGAAGGSVVGGVVAVGLLVAGRAGRKTLYPYGPSMILGAWLALAFAAPVADWYLGRFGLT